MAAVSRKLADRDVKSLERTFQMAQHRQHRRGPAQRLHCLRSGRFSTRTY